MVASATHICIPITSDTTAWVFRDKDGESRDTVMSQSKLEATQNWKSFSALNRSHTVYFLFHTHPNSLEPQDSISTLRSPLWDPNGQNGQSPGHYQFTFLTLGGLRKCQQLLNYLSKWPTGGFLPCRGHLWSVYNSALRGEPGNSQVWH